MSTAAENLNKNKDVDNRFLGKEGFLIEKIVSTLFQRPGEVRHMEEPREGCFPDAGFTIIGGVKHDGTMQ